MTDTGAVCSTPAALSGRRLVDLTRGELGCTTAGQQRVVVVGVICVGVVGLAVVVAVACCVCRQHLRHLAATCTVSARENMMNDYKSSYDNCIYLKKSYSQGGGEGGGGGVGHGEGLCGPVPCHFPTYNPSYQHLDIELKDDENGLLKPLCIQATQL